MGEGWASKMGDGGEGRPEQDVKLLRRVHGGKQVCTYCGVVINRNTQPAWAEARWRGMG